MWCFHFTKTKIIDVRDFATDTVLRDAGTTGAAGASAPLAFYIFNFVGAVRVQTMGATGAQNFYNRQN
jgi:hypothetical protein